MRWQLKALVQRTLAVLPNRAAQQLNYLLQRWVVRSFPTSERQFLLHFDEAAAHLHNFERHSSTGGVPIDALRAYEFGAGWDLIGPLSLFALGVNSQVVVDITPLVRWELVNHVLTLFDNRDELARRAGRQLRQLDQTPIGSAVELRQRFGIDYRAPCDARRTGLAERSFDLITSTFTLEHIPRADILAILRECRRLASPNAVLSCSVDMQDHYSFSDSRISVYNFLKYTDRVWEMVNSSLHHQNRLRARDYVSLFTQANLRLLDCDLSYPDEGQRELLATLPLAPRFARDYLHEELSPTSMLITAARGAQ